MFEKSTPLRDKNALKRQFTEFFPLLCVCLAGFLGGGGERITF